MLRTIRRFVRREILDSTFWWRWIVNPNRSARHRIASLAGRRPDRDVDVLRADGIILRRADEVLDADGLQQLDAIAAFTDARISEPAVQAALADPASLGTRKDYRIHLAPHEFDIDSPFIRLAINPSLVARVNGYLGMWSYLREVQIWLDMPTPGQAKETQLWHRDVDDHANLKVFVYLNAVSDGGGPFCFIPGTHVFGGLKTAVPETAPARMDDDLMANSLPPQGWKRCTGASRTLILADTTGFHKGLKPQDQHRVLISLHYTSGKPKDPRSFELRPSTRNDSLRDVQKYALFA